MSQLNTWSGLDLPLLKLSTELGLISRSDCTGQLGLGWLTELLVWVSELLDRVSELLVCVSELLVWVTELLGCFS